MFFLSDDLNDFFQINGKQEHLPPYAPPFVFTPHNAVSFVPHQQVPNSILSDHSTSLDYSWTLSGPNSTNVASNETSLIHNFTQVGEYDLAVNIIANITRFSTVKQGKVSQKIYIKAPISNVNIVGNNFVVNGSLLNLNISCNGSSNFMICYYFTESKANRSCFDRAKTLDTCFLPISHYFPQNGTHYLNIGIQNDVSEVMNNTKITIYKGSM